MEVIIRDIVLLIIILFNYFSLFNMILTMSDVILTFNNYSYN